MLSPMTLVLSSAASDSFTAAMASLQHHANERHTRIAIDSVDSPALEDIFQGFDGWPSSVGCRVFGGSSADGLQHSRLEMRQSPRDVVDVAAGFTAFAL